MHTDVFIYKRQRAHMHISYLNAVDQRRANLPTALTPVQRRWGSQQGSAAACLPVIQCGILAARDESVHSNHGRIRNLPFKEKTKGTLVAGGWSEPYRIGMEGCLGVSEPSSCSPGFGNTAAIGVYSAAAPAAVIHIIDTLALVDWLYGRCTYCNTHWHTALLASMNSHSDTRPRPG
jgi:hypothetical protein